MVMVQQCGMGPSKPNSQKMNSVKVMVILKYI